MECQVRIVIRGVAKREERVGWKKELHKEQLFGTQRAMQDYAKMRKAQLQKDDHMST